MSEITRTEPIQPTIANLMPPAMVDSLQRRALLAGVLAALLCILGAATHPHQFLRSYLVGYIMGLGLSLGSLGLLMVQYLTKGNWGFLIRRQLEAGSRVLPLMFVLFLPIALGIHGLYPWVDKSKLSAEDAGQMKMQAYLTPRYFYLRAVAYFLIWI